MASGAFATLSINSQRCGRYPERENISFARKQNMRVVVREAFMKGVLFRLARKRALAMTGNASADEMARVTARDR
jgi:hypothetical protein